MTWMKRLSSFVLVGVPLFLLYHLTRVQAHTWDAIAYTARAVGDPLLSEIYLSTRCFHPHHLFYIPFCFSFQWIFRLLGLAATDPFLPLQLANGLLGAGCALLAGSIVQRLSGSARRGLFTAIAVGLTNAVWFYATEVEEIVPALFFALLAVRLLVGAPSAGRWSAAGAALGLATLLHQLVVPLGLGLVAVLLAARDEDGRRRCALFFGTIWITTTAAAYLTVGIAAQGVRSAAGFMDWVLAARSRASFGHESSLTLIYQAVRALAESLVSTHPLTQLRTRAAGTGVLLGAAGASAVFLALVLGFAVLVLSTLRSLARPSRRLAPVVLGLLVGITLLALFILWFQPWNVDYWTYAVVLTWVVAAALAPLPSALRSSRGRRFACWAAALYCLALGGMNLGYRAIRLCDPETAIYRGIVDFARRQLRPPGGLLAVDEGFRPMESLAAVPFFARIPVVLASPDSLSADAQRARREIARYRVGGRPIYATARALAGIGPREREDVHLLGAFAGQSIYLLLPAAAPDGVDPGTPLTPARSSDATGGR